jgi:hypothetical protein
MQVAQMTNKTQNVETDCHPWASGSSVQHLLQSICSSPRRLERNFKALADSGILIPSRNAIFFRILAKRFLTRTENGFCP